MVEPNRLRDQVAPNTMVPHGGVAQPLSPGSGTAAPNAFEPARGPTFPRGRPSTLGTILIGAVGELVVLLVVGVIAPAPESPGFGLAVIGGEVVLGILLGLRTEGLKGYAVAWAGVFLGSAIAGAFVAMQYVTPISNGDPGALGAAIGAWLFSAIVVGFVAALFVLFGVYVGHRFARRRAIEAGGVPAGGVPG